MYTISSVTPYPLLSHVVLISQTTNAELVSLCKNREEMLSVCQKEVAKLKTTVSVRREEFDLLSDECADLKGLLEQKAREVEQKLEDLKALKVHTCTMMALMFKYTS